MVCCPAKKIRKRPEIQHAGRICYHELTPSRYSLTSVRHLMVLSSTTSQPRFGVIFQVQVRRETAAVVACRRPSPAHHERCRPGTSVDQPVFARFNTARAGLASRRPKKERPPFRRILHLPENRRHSATFASSSARLFLGNKTPKSIAAILSRVLPRIFVFSPWLSRPPFEAQTSTLLAVSSRSAIRRVGVVEELCRRQSLCNRGWMEY